MKSEESVAAIKVSAVVCTLRRERTVRHGHGAQPGFPDFIRPARAGMLASRFVAEIERSGMRGRLGQTTSRPTTLA